MSKVGYSCTVAGGLVVTPSGAMEVDLGIEDGKIAAIVKPGSLEKGERHIDATGKIVFPAVVDMHVHFNDPGLPDREDFFTGTCAAAAGGVGTVVDMPLSGNPAIVDVEALELKKKAAAEKAVVDYMLWGGLVNDNISLMQKMHEEGAVAFKAFTCFAGNDFPYAKHDILYRGMEEAARLGVFVGVHCEDEGLTSVWEARAKDQGHDSARAFLDAHAPITELLATDAVLEMARTTGARVHVVHATLPSVIDRVNLVRWDAKVTVETCPHYLVFTGEDLERLQGVLKCTPPVRSAEAVEGMWERVLAGAVDVISSDHSPSTLKQKTPASGSFWEMWGGIQGVQMMLPVLFSHGVKQRGMSLELLARLVSENPARLLGVFPRKGAVQVGSDADLAIVAPDEKWTLTPEQLLCKNKHSPYVGMALEGRVVMTMVRGKCVYDGAKVAVEPGYGKRVN